MSDKLFAGTRAPFGGLSNERELVSLCPDEFSHSNKWVRMASTIFFEGAHHIQDWSFKSNDVEVVKKQINLLDGLLRGFGLGHAEKEAVAGWMLSEMLNDVPKEV